MPMRALRYAAEPVPSEAEGPLLRVRDGFWAAKNPPHPEQAPLGSARDRLRAVSRDATPPRFHPSRIRSRDWRVELAEEFEAEFFDLPQDVRRTILAMSRLLREFGPQLGRPRVDTLNGSRWV